MTTPAASAFCPRASNPRPAVSSLPAARPLPPQPRLGTRAERRRRLRTTLPTSAGHDGPSLAAADSERSRPVLAYDAVGQRNALSASTALTHDAAGQRGRRRAHACRRRSRAHSTCAVLAHDAVGKRNTRPPARTVLRTTLPASAGPLADRPDASISAVLPAIEHGHFTGGILQPSKKRAAAQKRAQTHNSPRPAV